MKTKWIWLILAAAAVVVASGILRLRDPRSIAGDIQAMEALGVPTDYYKLNTNRPVVKNRADNAAEDYLSAQKMFQENAAINKAFHTMDSAKRSSTMSPAARQAIKTLQPLLERYRSGSLKSYAVQGLMDPQGIDEMGLDNAVVQGAMVLGSLSQVETMSGDPMKGLEEIATIGRMMKHRTWKYEISQILSLTQSHSAAMLAFAKVLERYPRDERVLLAAAKVWDDLPALPTIKDMLAADLPYQIRTLRYAVDKPAIYQTSRESPAPAKGPVAVNAVTTQAAVGQVVHALRGALEEVSEHPDDFYANATVVKKAGDDLDQLKPANLLIDNPFTMPMRSYVGYAERLGVSVAFQRLNKVTLDQLLERLKSGAFSERLPDHGMDGMDPFTGKPLIYRREKEGFVLYSIGADGIDNGGTLRSVSGNPDRVFGATPDVVMKVRK